MSDARLEFTPTPAVAAARSHNRYAVCPACQRDVPKYLFHRAGVRFVRCASCDAVYGNPAREHPVNNFDIAQTQHLENPRDRELMVSDMAALLERVAADHQELAGAPLRRTLLLGHNLPEFATLGKDIGLDVPTIGDDVFAKLALDSDIRPFAAMLQKVPQVVLLQELLESCSDPGAVVAKLAAEVIDTVLAKELPIDREVIIVESNSTDGTREIVQRYEDYPGVRVVYEDRPRGKGHAVRTGLQHVTGTIVLIQDSDFEYDIEDYDALLEPLLQRKTMIVLGSRSLGLDDWKVRKYDSTPIRGALLNFAQVMFAKTYNVLYQQRATDVNTMFKVFRSECLDGLDLHSNGVELDIELACKLARNGNSPMEVPVNYIARGFEDGKKIRFWRDAVPSYFALYRYRFTK